MILSNNQKIDLGNPIDLRIKKTEDIARSLATLTEIMAQYSYHIKLLSTIEVRLAKELECFYQGQNIYSDFILRFSIALKLRNNLVYKDLSVLEEELRNFKGEERVFKNVNLIVKDYFANSELLHHYECKLPKLFETSEAQKKLNGALSDRFVKKITRNEKKLEDARSNTFIAATNIIKFCDAFNIERFTKINPLLNKFIQFGINYSNNNYEKFYHADKEKDILNYMETHAFNLRFYPEMEQRDLDRLNFDTNINYVVSQNKSIKNFISPTNQINQTSQDELVIGGQALISHNKIERNSESQLIESSNADLAEPVPINMQPLYTSEQDKALKLREKFCIIF